MSKTASKPCYERVIITGRLSTLSELRIGSGLTGSRQDGRDKELTVNEMILDSTGQAYIPASSLRGYLAAILRRELEHSEVNPNPDFQALFGLARRSSNETEENENAGNMGALRIYDARMTGKMKEEILQSRVAIDPVTATAKEHHLFNDTLVPEGTEFNCHIELDHVNKTQLNSLLKALNTLNGVTAQLGQGKSIGRGLVAWTEGKIKTIDQSQLVNWLLDNTDQPLGKYLVVSGDTTPKDSYEDDWDEIRLKIIPDSPILINDPFLVQQDDDHDMKFLRRNTHMLIPGSSIKGMFRARSRRILLTLSQNPAKADKLVDQMFGSTKTSGVLRFYDVLTKVDEKAIHKQTLIAVDRFTAGVKNGAMLNIEAAKPEEAIATVMIQKNICAWQSALWLYCLRDVMEGDLALGWGQARGFGAFHSKLRDGEQNWLDWPQYYKTLASDSVDTYIAALSHSLKDVSKNVAPKPAGGEI